MIASNFLCSYLPSLFASLCTRIRYFLCLSLSLPSNCCQINQIVNRVTYSLRQSSRVIQHTWWSPHHVVDYFPKIPQPAVFYSLYDLHSGLINWPVCFYAWATKWWRHYVFGLSEHLCISRRFLLLRYFKNGCLNVCTVGFIWNHHGFWN